MSKKTIGIDPGKKNVKAGLLVDNVLVDKIIFPSLTEQLISDEIEISTPYSWIIKEDDRLYGVGNICKTLPNSDPGKFNDHTRIILNTVLSYYCDETDEVDIVIGSKTNDALNKKYREEFSEFIRQGGVIDILYKDNNTDEYIEKTIVINKVLVVSEGIALVPRYKLNRELRRKSKTMMKNDLVIVIDLGGLDGNVRFFENGIAKTIFSLSNAGINTLESNVKLYISQNVNLKHSLQAIDIEACIKNKLLPQEFGGSRLLNIIIEKFITENIIIPIQGFGVNIKAQGIPIIFTGGESVLLKDYIFDTLKNPDVILSDTNVWDNLLSYFAKWVTECNEPERNVQLEKLMEVEP